MLSLPALILTPILAFSLTTGMATALELRTYTASELGFLVNSHLILGDEQAILVDAQFTRSEAFDVVRLIRSFDRELTTIFITRAHPEHYLGLEVFKEQFPSVKVLARPAVAEAIRQRGQAAIELWEPLYLGDLATTVVVPEAFEDDVLRLGEEEIRLLGSDPTLLYLPSVQTLLSSDMTSGGVHLWLEGVNPGAWLGLLQGLDDVGPIDFVYPGHGPSSGARLLEEGKRYLGTLRRASTGDPTPDAVVSKMKSSFPEYQLLVLLERSAKKFLRGDD